MEPKPTEQYVATPDDNGKQPVPDGLATIDEQSRQVAMARAMLENSIAQREQQCGAEIQAAVETIAKKHHCVISIIETRDVGADRVISVGLRAIAIERTQQRAAG